MILTYDRFNLHVLNSPIINSKIFEDFNQGACRLKVLAKF